MTKRKSENWKAPTLRTRERKRALRKIESLKKCNRILESEKKKIYSENQSLVQDYEFSLELIQNGSADKQLLARARHCISVAEKLGSLDAEVETNRDEIVRLTAAIDVAALTETTMDKIHKGEPKYVFEEKMAVQPQSGEFQGFKGEVKQVFDQCSVVVYFPQLTETEFYRDAQNELKPV